ncbi:hypothetical protein BP6252_09007 [Coleophoma cylindrospora]|uniref:Zn(2)-C6 fungal-type domain-containing protein n=1 Tax=Coleophoma cylindrospora TaxID=1849047 RepID=A0A3D8R122_9HELO|nr:hypothetical protein BP6252_09007 [Coleophoma cylindrospora]
MPSEARKRRNGQLQACESCRKAKVRCDHGDPICGRCVRRNLSCIYHPAPLTRPRQAKVIPSPPYSIPTATRSPTIISFVSPVTPASETPTRTNSLFHKPPSAYGATRFSAIFSENQASFEPALLDVTEDESSSTVPKVIKTGDKSAALMELAIDTLLNFPTLRVTEILTAGSPYVMDSWVSPTMIQNCLSQIWTQYGALLGGRRSRNSVAQMAIDIMRNTKSSIRTDNEDSDWQNWFGGPRLRWEMIGVVFTWAGFAIKHSQEWDPLFRLEEMKDMNRKSAAEVMKQCASNCLDLCDTDDAEVNDILVVLMKNRWKLQSIIVSDESDRLRIGSGMVVGAFITAGLHRLPHFTRITANSQYRTCLAASLYYLDKCESLFTGRPPLFNRDFCHCPLPLDLAEDELFNGPDNLANAVAKLDANGWNTDGKIHPTTWLRALCLQLPIREGILHFSLGVNVQFAKVDIDNLTTQLNGIVDSYPAHLQFATRSQNLSKTRDPSSSSAREFYIKSRLQLDVLQCHFLLQRLSVSRGFVSGQKLLDVAVQMMNVVLSLWLNRDELIHFNFAFDWVVVCYGIPCAGVLCVELLKTAKAHSESERPPLSFSKSDVIQSLTIFIAYLNWIRPSDGNAELCWRLKKVVKRIVDSVLDGTAESAALPENVPTPPPPKEANEQTTEVDFLSDLDPQLLGLDDLDWLNTIDWTQGDWLDMNQQSTL